MCGADVGGHPIGLWLAASWTARRVDGVTRFTLRVSRWPYEGDEFCSENHARGTQPACDVFQVMTTVGWAKLESVLCLMLEAEIVAIRDRVAEMVW